MDKSIFDEIQIDRKEVKDIVTLTFPNFRKRKVTIVMSQNKAIEIVYLCLTDPILLQFDKGKWQVIARNLTEKKYFLLEKNQVLVSKGLNFLRIVCLEHSKLFTDLNFKCTDYSIYKLIEGELTFIQNKATKYY